MTSTKLSCFVALCSICLLLFVQCANAQSRGDSQTQDPPSSDTPAPADQVKDDAIFGAAPGKEGVAERQQKLLEAVQRAMKEFSDAQRNFGYKEKTDMDNPLFADLKRIVDKHSGVPSTTTSAAPKCSVKNIGKSGGAVFFKYKDGSVMEIKNNTSLAIDFGTGNRIDIFPKNSFGHILITNDMSTPVKFYDGDDKKLHTIDPGKSLERELQLNQPEGFYYLEK